MRKTNILTALLAGFMLTACTTTVRNVEYVEQVPYVSPQKQALDSAFYICDGYTRPQDCRRGGTSYAGVHNGNITTQYETYSQFGNAERPRQREIYVAPQPVIIYQYPSNSRSRWQRDADDRYDNRRQSRRDDDRPRSRDRDDRPRDRDTSRRGSWDPVQDCFTFEDGTTCRPGKRK